MTIIKEELGMAESRFVLKGYHGGTFLEGNRDRSIDQAITKAQAPGILVFPMTMHIGQAAKPVVKVGDSVKIGSLLGQAQGHVSANIHSSVSGQVISVENRMLNGRQLECVIVKNDYQDDQAPALTGYGEDLEPETIIDLIRQAGIAGMGGAEFPTAVKLIQDEGEKINHLIVNGAECEPYATSDYRTILEKSEQILEGIRLLDQVFEVKTITITLEKDMAQAGQALEKQIAQTGYSKCQVKLLPTQYPQGAERKLIEVCKGLQVPSGGLPKDVGCLVSNVGTLVAIYQAVRLGKPLTERVVTVTGSPIKEAKNLLVRIGTPVDDLIDQCGGFDQAPRKVLLGGPMMGQAINDGGIPISKGTTHVTFLAADEVDQRNRMDCIRCAECLNVCPVGLQPILISNAYERGDIQAAQELGALDCIECGNCSYICPSHIPLLENIRKAKVTIREREG